MKPLFLLISSFLLGILIAYVLKGDPHFSFNGNLSMALMFCFTAIDHFKFRKGMTMMLPANIYAALHHVDYEKGTYDSTVSTPVLASPVTTSSFPARALMAFASRFLAST